MKNQKLELGCLELAYRSLKHLPVFAEGGRGGWFLLLFLALACEEKTPTSGLSASNATDPAGESSGSSAFARQEPSVKVEKAVIKSAPPPWSSRRVEGSGFPCAVEDVLAMSCRRCHWEPQENDAPFAMVKWEDTQQMRSGKAIHVLMKQMVTADLMPPLDALVEPDVDALSPAQKTTLLTWLDAGAKKSAESCPPQ